MVSIQPSPPAHTVYSPSNNENLLLAGNVLLPLDSSNQIWQVQSGSVSIFAIARPAGEKDKSTGPRHYLFSVTQPELLFSTAPEADGSEAYNSEAYGLLAITLEPTVLIPLPEKESLLPLQKQISVWLSHFPQIHGFPKLELPPSITSSQYVSLNDGECYHCNQPLIWLQIKAGQALWLGDLDMPIISDSNLFPLPVGTWIQAQNSVEIRIYNLQEITEFQSVYLGFSKFHHYALKLIEQLITAQSHANFQQFQQQQQLDQQTTQQALQNLASLLKPKDDSFLSAETPLLIAAGAVGHILGVRILPPSQSENLALVKDPLEAIARASQIRLRQILLRGQWWRQDSGPIVAYRRSNHQPVALLPIGSRGYELLDPLTLQRTPVDATIANQLEPTASIFYKPLSEGKLTAWNLLQFAFYGRRRDLWMIFITGIATSLLGMAIPQATAVLIDEAIPYGSREILLQIGLALMAVAFGQVCFQFAQMIAAMRIETASDATLQTAVWDRLLKLPTAFFKQYSTGDLQSRVSGITAIRRKLSGTALDAILSGAFSLLNLALLFYYSAKLAILALAVALIVVSVTLISGTILLKKQRPLLALDGDLYGLMVQLINGVPKLRIAGAEARAFAQWSEKYRQQLRLEMSTQQLEDAVTIFNTAMPTLTAIGLFLLASTLIDPMNSVELSTGTFLAFSAAFGIFISGATSLSLTVIDVLAVVPLWERSQPILTAALEVDSQKADPGRLTGHVCLDRVTFRYREDGPLILENVTVKAHPGEFIALVGPSGSGKSTLLRLLLGFETPQSGTVYYDNQDVSGIDISAVRRQLGVVLQNGRITAGSLFENISGGALITLDEAWQAAEMAGFAEDVRSFPMQMHTVISEGGGNLSGGQRQRLVIARALALRPKILLLDEATSALDNRTQAIVSESLDKLKVTRIVVAHRLSTIRNADCIYVIKAGRVVEQGSFEQLAQQQGVFAQLIQRQMA